MQSFLASIIFTVVNDKYVRPNFPYPTIILWALLITDMDMRQRGRMWRHSHYHMHATREERGLGDYEH